MPFKNVEYIHDLFTWAEADGLTGDDTDRNDNDTEGAWDGLDDGEVIT